MGEQQRLPAFFSFLLGFRIYLFAERDVTLVNALLSHVQGVKSKEGRRAWRERGEGGEERGVRGAGKGQAMLCGFE